MPHINVDNILPATRPACKYSIMSLQKPHLVAAVQLVDFWIPFIGPEV